MMRKNGLNPTASDVANVYEIKSNVSQMVAKGDVLCIHNFNSNATKMHLQLSSF